MFSVAYETEDLSKLNIASIHLFAIYPYYIAKSLASTCSHKIMVHSYVAMYLIMTHQHILSVKHIMIITKFTAS